MINAHSAEPSILYHRLNTDAYNDVMFSACANLLALILSEHMQEHELEGVGTFQDTGWVHAVHLM